MKSGISYPSYARDMTWSSTSGIGWQADYPVTNVGLLDEVRRVASANAAANNIFGALAANKPIDFVALVHHNLPAGHVVNLIVYSDAAKTVQVHNGNYTVPAAGDFPAVLPMRLPAAVSGRAIYIGIPTTGQQLEVGAVEVGLFWEWNVEVPRAIGVDSRSSVTEFAGVQHVTRQWAPRIVTGERELIAQSEVDTKFMDFQMDTGLSKAFVWCWDAEDPTTWARQSMLVTNSSLPPGTVPDWNVGRMGFAFREHLR